MYRKLSKRYLFVAVVCAVFTIVYECFGHGMWSYWMRASFAWPLLLAALPFAVLAKTRQDVGEGSRLIYQAGVITLMVGSLFQGVLDIYGTVSSLAAVFWIVGGTLSAAGSVIAFVQLYRAKKRFGAAKTL